MQNYEYKPKYEIEYLFRMKKRKKSQQITNLKKLTYTADITKS